MAKQGKVIPASSYTRSGGTGATITDQVADDRVLELIADGATLVLQALHRNWPPLIDFGGALAGDLGHPVQINAYVTPAQNQGFAAHYDTHDVFVLQVSGTKRWLIHEPVFADPLPGQVWEQHRAEVAAVAAGTPLLDLTLQPGDALYLPRGYLHSAQALGELSVHLTVGVHPVTRYSLAKQLLAEAAKDGALRASLPMGVDLSDPAVLSRHLAETVGSLLDFAQSDGPLPAVSRAVAADLAGATRPAPISPLAQLDAVNRLTVHDVLALRPGLRVRVDHRPDGLGLHTADRTFSLETQEEAAVKLILAGEPFTAAQLPGLDAERQLELARQLLRAAVLVPVSGG